MNLIVFLRDTANTFGKIIALRVRGLQAMGITLSSLPRTTLRVYNVLLRSSYTIDRIYVRSTTMESQHSTGRPSCHDFPRFVIVSEKSTPEVGNRWLRSSQNGGFFGKKDPLRASFHNCFPNAPQRTRKHVFLCKFREIWPTGSRWIFNRQKNKISARAPAAASARIVPKICQGQFQTIYWVPQISSKSVHFRRSYSRTREHRSNPP